MRLAQNPGNMLDIRRAFANVPTSALLKNWNRIEIGTSNSFETLRAHALRTAFCEWALAVDHVNALACDAHDSDSSNAGPDAQESVGKDNFPLALSLPLTLNTWPAEGRSDEGPTKLDEPPEDRAKCQCWCGCRRQPGQGCRRHCPNCSSLVGPGCCWTTDEIGLCHECYRRRPGL